ncbi:hypothetical protein [Paenibacillus elgii]|uniref:hypothetical protein n=1 Tax=Paenibacillus elgii TaxID=189691 RepID=UPI0030DB90D3
MDIHAILEQLRTERPVFSNEADFQYALAWQIRTSHPDAKIRFEVKPPGSRIYPDLVVTHEERRTAIELKYLKRKAEVEIGGEMFSLSDTSWNRWVHLKPKRLRNPACCRNFRTFSS